MFGNIQDTPLSENLSVLRPIKQFLNSLLLIMTLSGNIHLITPSVFNALYGTYIGLFLVYLISLSIRIIGLFLYGSVNLFPVSKIASNVYLLSLIFISIIYLLLIIYLWYLCSFKYLNIIIGVITIKRMKLNK